MTTISLNSPKTAELSFENAVIDGMNSEVSSMHAMDHREYLINQGAQLSEKGFKDAANNPSLENFKSSCDEIKSQYINWTNQHQAAFKTEHQKSILSLKERIEKLKGELSAHSSRIEPVQTKRNSIVRGIDSIEKRDYKTQSLITLLVCVCSILALSVWCSFYYGSCFYLSQITPLELINHDTGEIIPLFSVENYIRGWYYSVAAIAIAIASGFLNKNKLGMLLEMSVFALMDVLLALKVESQLGHAYELMGVVYSFSWIQFLLNIAYGLVPSIFLCVAVHISRKAVLLDDYMEKKTDMQSRMRELETIDPVLASLNNTQNTLLSEKEKCEQMLAEYESDDITTSWYSGRALETLLHSYMKGWRDCLNVKMNADNMNETNRLLSEAQSVVDSYKRAA